MKRLYYLFILLFAVSLVSCKDTEQSSSVLIWESDSISSLYQKNGTGIVSGDGKIPDDFIFKFKDETHMSTIHEFEKIWNIRKENIDSCSCDSMLRRYKNFPLRKIFRSSEPLAQRTTNKTGENLTITDDIAFFSPNYKIDRPLNDNSLKNSDSFQLQDLRQLKEVINPKVKVAIFDTGYDTNSGLINTPVSIECKEFNDFQEADKNKHGTAVTALLLSSMGEVRNEAQIIPVKILDSKGEGTLFNLVCGLASLKNQNVDILNLSLGFYAPSDSIPSKLLKTYLENTEAWIFAAAGNASQAVDEIERQRGINNVRDLAQRRLKFYPACLTDIDKLIAVTSSKKNKIPYEVCNTQNFSDRYIDLAVEARNNECNISVLDNHWGGRGSSFATPIAAGKAAALQTSGLQVDKNTLFINIGVQRAASPSQVKVGVIQSP